MTGRELCMLPEPEFHRRVRATAPGQLGASLATKVGPCSLTL